MEQRKILISGRVQGVGFRAFVEKHARKLGLKGYVRNLSDGSVEVLAQGNEKELEEIISLCKKGPAMSRVDNVEVDSENLEEQYQDFSISY